MMEKKTETIKVTVEQNRFRSWALWVSVVGAVWTILSVFGLPQKWGVTDETLQIVLNCVGTILIAFGIVNNPTDKTHI